MSPQPLLFVQGAGDMWAPDGSGVLARYLTAELGDQYKVIAPEMPDAATEPHYLPWRDHVHAELQAVDGAVILIGHSFGGSVLLKYLAECQPPVPICGLFLVAVPFWGPEGWAHDEYALSEDFASRLPSTPTFLYHSRDDPHVPFSHLKLYEERLPKATFRPLEGAEHSFVSGLPALVIDIRLGARFSLASAPHHRTSKRR